MRKMQISLKRKQFGNKEPRSRIWAAFFLFVWVIFYDFLFTSLDDESFNLENCVCKTFKMPRAMAMIRVDYILALLLHLLIAKTPSPKGSSFVRTSILTITNVHAHLQYVCNICSKFPVDPQFFSKIYYGQTDGRTGVRHNAPEA